MKSELETLNLFCLIRWRGEGPEVGKTCLYNTCIARSLNILRKDLTKIFKQFIAGAPYFGPYKGSASKNECPSTAYDPTFIAESFSTLTSTTNVV